MIELRITKGARLAHVAFLALTLSSGCYTGTDRPGPELTREYTAPLLRTEDASGVMKLMEASRRHGSGRKITEEERKYMDSVLEHAGMASTALNIPRSFILSQWLMESGALNRFSVKRNNLAGIQKKNSLRSFNSLRDFTEEYIRTLKGDAIQNIADLPEFVTRLHSKHYFTAREKSYLNGLSWRLGFMVPAQKGIGRMPWREFPEIFRNRPTGSPGDFIREMNAFCNH